MDLMIYGHQKPQCGLVHNITVFISRSLASGPNHKLKDNQCLLSSTAYLTSPP